MGWGMDTFGEGAAEVDAAERALEAALERPPFADGFETARSGGSRWEGSRRWTTRTARRDFGHGYNKGLHDTAQD